jgi:hypothetical protein
MRTVGDFATHGDWSFSIDIYNDDYSYSSQALPGGYRDGCVKLKRFYPAL